MKMILLSPNSIGDIIASLIVGNACRSVADVSYIVPEAVGGLFDGSEFRAYGRNDLPKDAFDLLIDLASTKRSRHIVRSIRAREKIGRASGQVRRIYLSALLYHTTVEKHPAGHIVHDYEPILDNLDLPLASTLYLSHRTDSQRFDKEVCIHIGAKTKFGISRPI